MPIALNWLAIARECFHDEHGSLDRGLLTSVFALVIGIQRMFHLDQMEDVGFALLTGGRKCPSRHLVGAWRRHLTWYEVDRFCRRTNPWECIAGQESAPMRANLDGEGKLNGIGASVPFYPGGQYGSFPDRSQSPGVAAAILAV